MFLLTLIIDNHRGVHELNNRWVYGIVGVTSVVFLVTAGAFLSEEGTEEKQVDFESIDNAGVSHRKPLGKETVFINSAEEYNEFIGKIPDNIDFEEKTVIAVFLGSRPTGGYSAEVKNIIEKEDKMVINVQETRPGDSCKVIMAVTYPYDAVLVEKIEDEPEVEINVSVDVSECG